MPSNGSFREDWTRPESYPPFACADYRRLAWEFIRRDADYAKDAAVMLRLSRDEFETGIKKDSTVCLAGLHCSPKAGIGERAKDYIARMERENKSWRIGIPRDIFRSRWSLEEPVSPDTRFDPNKVIFSDYLVRIKRVTGEKPVSHRLRLWPDEIAVRLRLDLSLDSQLKQLRRRFEDEREAYANEMGSAAKDPRLTDLKLAHYWLRCYDAHLALNSGANCSLANHHAECNPTYVAEYLDDEYHKQGTLLGAGGGDLGDIQKRILPVTVSRVNTWRATAQDYIENKKFRLLLLAPRQKIVLEDVWHKRNESR